MTEKEKGLTICCLNSEIIDRFSIALRYISSDKETQDLQGKAPTTSQNPKKASDLGVHHRLQKV